MIREFAPEDPDFYVGDPRLREKRGVGMLAQILFGPLSRYGLTGSLDDAR